MELTKELIEKAKTAKSPEELLEMAKAEGIEMTEDEAAKAFARLNNSGELADDELDNVSGGGCNKPKYKCDKCCKLVTKRSQINFGGRILNVCDFCKKDLLENYKMWISY